jgi:hypothetical protein
MQQLGVNLIRTYSVKASGDHSGCMSAFENAGIYVLLDFNSFTSTFDAVGLLYRVKPPLANADYEGRLHRHGLRANTLTVRKSWTRSLATTIFSGSSLGMSSSMS